MAEVVGEMTLRDWYAGQALAMAGAILLAKGEQPASAEKIAESCFVLADAMTKERDGG